MTTAEMKAEFNNVIDGATGLGNAHAVARLELAREFFTDPDFARKLADHLWNTRKS